MKDKKKERWEKKRKKCQIIFILQVKGTAFTWSNLYLKGSARNANSVIR